MNETVIASVLDKIYSACTIIEFAKDQIEEYDDQEFWTEIYDELFEFTNIIEERYGII